MVRDRARAGGVVTRSADLLAGFADKFRRHPDGVVLPPHQDRCLGCGPDNPHGHHLEAVRRGEHVEARHVFDGRHEGGPGIAHGGAVATVLDDLYGFLLYAEGGPAVTRRLEVEYLRPVYLSTPYLLEARVDRRDERKLFLSAEIHAAGGAAAVTSTAFFLKVDLAHFRRSPVISQQPPSLEGETE